MKNLIISFLLLIAFSVDAQKTVLDYQKEAMANFEKPNKNQTKQVSTGINELDKKNGFQDIKLGNNISQYQIKQPDENEKKFKERTGLTEIENSGGKNKHYELSKQYYIGNIQVTVNVSTTAYGVIKSISVTLPFGFKMLDNLKETYGKPNFDTKLNCYSWSGKKVNLCYCLSSNELYYTSKNTSNKPSSLDY